MLIKTQELKKNIILIILGLIIFSGAAGFIYYKYFYNREDIEVFDLIPENAIAVYESKNIISTWNNLQEKNLWSSLILIPEFSQIEKSLNELDSISGQEGKLDKVFKNNSLCVSFHQISKESYGTVFYFKIQDLEQYDILNKILSTYQNNGKLNTDSRTYLGEKITEIRDNSSKNLFSYIIYRDHFAGSFFPVLIEDVIRNVDADDALTFKDRNAALFSIPGTDRDEENLFFNTGKINSVLSIFSESNENNDAITHFAEATRLSFEIHDQEMYFNGYTLAGNSKNDFYLGTFKGQRPGKLQMSKLVPNRTATFFHVTFDNALSWYKNLNLFWNNKSPSQVKNHQKFLNQYKINPDKFYNWMGGEIALVNLQSLNLANPDKLVIIKADDIQEAYNQMNKLADRAAIISEDSLYKENFSTIDIRQLYINEFPSNVFGDHLTGFPNSFYFVVDNYLIIGNSLQVIKSTIADIEADNVWGKSVTMNQYFEKSLGEANITYIINTQRSWNAFMNILNNKWNQTFNKNNTPIKNFDMISFQFSDTEDKFYTSINVRHHDVSKINKEGQKFNLAANLALDVPIISKPFYVKNPEEKSFHVILQDSLYNLYKVSLEGEILWKENIGEKVIGEIHQIDYLKNGHHQYAFATPRALHVLSQEGSYINNNFPQEFEDHVEFMTVVDYDNSKNYRFLVSTNNGNLYMFDKEMVALEGWNPKEMKDKSATAPFHIRVRGKDCIISLQENGILSVITRKGEMYPGFPVNLQGKFSNSLYIEAGPTFSQTILTTISEKGELIKINLEGKLIKKEQFYRPSKETRFVLCVDEFQKNYVIARQDLGILTLLDAKGEVILEKDYITSGALEIQYFNAGVEKEIYAVTDKIQEFTYLYDYRGNLINSRPIDSGHKIALKFTESTGKYDIIANYNTRFSRIDFQK